MIKYPAVIARTTRSTPVFDQLTRYTVLAGNGARGGVELISCLRAMFISHGAIILLGLEIMEHTITLKKLAYGERPLTCFSFCFSSCEIYLPNYEDLRPAHKETIFERITNDPENLVNSLTHEILHGWIYENLDKNTSLRFDNIDKDSLEEHYLISNLTLGVTKSKRFIKRGVYYILRTVIK